MPLGDRLLRYLPVVTTLLLLFLTGCSGGHSARTLRMRTALEAGRLEEAVAALNDELGVKSGRELPHNIVSDDALLVLDRATLHQSLARHDVSKRDYEAADKAIDVLDLSKGTADDIGRWVFSDSSGRYVAPPHEKLLVNVLNMLNYLETNDLGGARVEARRMVVSSRFLRERERADDPALGFGSAIAGFTFEKSGDLDEARRFYADAARIDEALERAAGDGVPEGHGEVLLVVGHGRVPHRVAERVPIGLALTRAAPYLSAGDGAKASKLAAQGLVTWVSYPRLAQRTPPSHAPSATIDGRSVHLELGLDVDALVRSEWQKIEGQVMAAAVSRAVARVAAGKAIEGAASLSDKKSVKAIGFLASLVLQATLSAADTPDTRSWETLPARMSYARVVLPAGEHEVTLDARGFQRKVRVRVQPGGWNVATLLALR